MNRIALCLAILFVFLSPAIAQEEIPDDLFNSMTIEAGGKKESVEPKSNPTPVQEQEPVYRPEPVSTPALQPDSGNAQGQGDIYIVPDEPSTPSVVVPVQQRDGNVRVPDDVKPKPLRNRPDQRTQTGRSGVPLALIVAGLAAVALVGAAVAVVKLRRPSCPRCGALLKGGKCPVCQWPAVLCDICQKEPLVDGICPHCGDSLPGHPEIRYNGGYDSIGRRQGGFGIVYRAISRSGDGWRGGFVLKRAKTLRELNDSMVGAEEYKARRDGIVFEADVLEFLSKSGYRNAPALLARGVVASGADNVWSGPWYLMETAVGTRLDAWMKSRAGGFSQQVEGRMLCALAEALVNLHKCGVAHRDFKPENVFWDEAAGRITLIDYGSASLPGKDNPMDNEKAPVSRFWAPPEQLSNRLGQNDAAADAYSFGVIFCTVVLGLERLEQDALASYLGPVADKVGTPMARLVFGKLLGTDREARKKALAELSDTLAGQKGGQ